MPPFVGLGVNKILVPAHIAVSLAVMDTLTVCGLFTFIVSALEAAVFDVTHVSELVRIQVTTSPSFKVDELNVEPVPMLMLFTCQSYEGLDPSLLTEEVNEILVPAQIVEADGLMEMLGVTCASTTIVMLADVAGPVVQVSEEVSTQCTTSPLANDELLYVLPVPLLDEFTNHS